MKKVFLLVAFALVGLIGYSQTLPLSVDTVKIYKKNHNAELILQNGTDTVPGFLFNTGTGHTAFKRPLKKINDSTYLIGVDTLKIRGGTGGGGGPTYTSGSGINISGGNVISNTGVLTYNGRSGAVGPDVSDYSSFYYPLSSNPAGYITTNQGITWTGSGDVTGTASGTTALSPSLTVVRIRGISIPTMAAGVLRYTGSALAWDNTAYYSSADTGATIPNKGWVNNRAITISANTGTGVVIVGTATQSLGTPPAWTVGIDTNKIMTRDSRKKLTDSISLIIGQKVVSYDNMAAIDASAASTGITINVRGFYAPGDGGGGNFYWSSSSTATPVPGKIIQITGIATGRLITLDPLNGNVLSFGAKGDGTTNNTVPINAAVDYLATTGGLPVRTLLFPNGSYKADSIKIRNLNYIGENGRVTLIPTTSSATGFFSLVDTPVNKITIANFTIVGNPANAGQHGFNVTAIPQTAGSHTGGMWYSKFENLYIDGFRGHGFHFVCHDGLGDMANQFLTFDRVIVHATADAGSRGLYAEGQFGQIRFNNSQIDGLGQSNIGVTGIELNSSLVGNDQVYNVTFDNVTSQALWKTMLTYDVRNVTYMNGHLENDSFAVHATTQSRVAFHDNELGNVATGTNAWVAGNDGSVLDYYNNIREGNMTGRDYYSPTGSPGGGRTDGNKWQGNGSFQSVFTGQLLNYSGGSISIGYFADILAATTTSSSNFINTIVGNQGPGELITIRAKDQAGNGGYVLITRNGGGNIDVSSFAPAGFIELRDRDAVILKRSDIGNVWNVVGVSKSNMYGTAIPTTGAYLAGDVLWNPTPTTGGISFWMCTASGTPGSWASSKLGTLSSSDTVNLSLRTDTLSANIVANYFKKPTGTTSQFLQGNGTPAAVTFISSLTGDVTGSGPGATAATLATVNSNTGTLGDAASTLVLTLDQKGRVTAATKTPINLGTYKIYTANGVHARNDSTFVGGGIIDSTLYYDQRGAYPTIFDSAQAGFSIKFLGNKTIGGTDSVLVADINGRLWKVSAAGFGGGGSYTFSQSLVNNSGVVTLSGDAATPGNSQLYGTTTSGTKGWLPFSGLPVTGPTNGLFSTSEKARLDSTITIVNSGGLDSIAVSSRTLDTLYLKSMNIVSSGSNGNIIVSKTLSLYSNIYGLSVDTTTGLLKVATQGFVQRNFFGVATSGARGFIPWYQDNNKLSASPIKYDTTAGAIAFGVPITFNGAGADITSTVTSSKPGGLSYIGSSSSDFSVLSSVASIAGTNFIWVNNTSTNAAGSGSSSGIALQTAHLFGDNYISFYNTGNKYIFGETSKFGNKGMMWLAKNAANASFGGSTGLLGIDSAGKAVLPGYGGGGNLMLYVDNSGNVLTQAIPSGGGSGITGVSGDVSGTGSGIITTTLATVNSNVFTTSTPVKITVNAKGLVTSATALNTADLDGIYGFHPISGNQTITLSNDLTGSGTTAISATVGANKITYAKMQQASPSKLIGNVAGTTGNLGEIGLGSGLSFSAGNLTLSGIANSSLANSGITIASSDFSGTGTVALGGTATLNINGGAVTYNKIQNVTTQKLLGRYTNTNGIPQEVSIASGLSLNTSTGELGLGGTLTQNITINGGGFSLTMGTSGNPLTGFSVYSNGTNTFAGGQFNNSDGSQLLVPAGTVNNPVTAASGVVTDYSGTAFQGSSLTASNAMTYTNASTVYINGAPTAGSNVTIGNPLALKINGASLSTGLIKYSSDLSGSYDGRSLVDKTYVDNAAGNSTIFRQTADNTVANTAGNTSIVGTGVGFTTVSANTLTVGKRITMKGFAYISTASVPPSLSIAFTNSTSNGSVGVGGLLTANMANANMEYELYGTIRSTGTSGTIMVGGWVSVNGTKVYVSNTAGAINTTVNQTFDIFANFGTASPSNSIVSKQHFLSVN